MELIETYFEEDTECNKTNFSTTTQILAELTALTPIKLNSNNIGKALRQLKFKRIALKDGKNTKYGFYLHKLK